MRGGCGALASSASGVRSAPGCGVSVMALPRHARDKDDLLDRGVEHVLSNRASARSAKTCSSTASMSAAARSSPARRGGSVARSGSLKRCSPKRAGILEHLATRAVLAVPDAAGSRRVDLRARPAASPRAGSAAMTRCTPRHAADVHVSAGCCGTSVSPRSSASGSHASRSPSPSGRCSPARTPPGWRSATSPRPFQRRLATIVDGITAP